MKRPYRLSAQQAGAVKEQLAKALEAGWIQPSKSPWGAAVLMVPKKDGSWRLCVDYRDLNALTIQDAYPLPRIDDLLHRLAGSRYFSRLDLQAGYHQIWIQEQDREKTAFRLSEPVMGTCHYEWRVMPFGLKNAPPTFQRYMTLVMDSCADCCVVYMDDLLVYSEDLQSHGQHLHRVLQVLRDAQLKVKLSKYLFAQQEIDFLGHRIKYNTIAMAYDKTEAINAWPEVLKTVKQVRQFIGLVSYYRMFISHFATLAEPLIDMTRKTGKVIWTWEATQAVSRAQGSSC